MKIAIDVSPVIYETGVSTYTRSLVHSLAKIDQSNQYTLFGGSLRRKKDLEKFAKSITARNFKSKFINVPPLAMSFMWNRLHTFPVENILGSLDVFHSSDWTQPPTRAYKVTTIHDLVPLRFPDISHPKIVTAHKKRLEWVKKEIDCVIAVSEFTKKEIIDIIGIDEKKIVVIPEAGSDLSSPSDDKIEITKRFYGLGDYLLVVGADPRKNVENIIKSFEKIKAKNKSMQLVIVGRSWKALPQVKDVIELGHIRREELLRLYSGARGLVYPSTYEGFGLPVLEAMELGCPVVTSNISSMPEVAGDAAALVDPYDVDSITHGINLILVNKKSYVDKGKKQVKKFSWDKTAKMTLEVYKQAK
jgi:glycosyltransferase involved in cell wall biosynthesis